jgi:hypothetical protein
VNGKMYNGAGFSFRTPHDSNGNYNQGVLDIIDVGPVKAGSSFFLPLFNPNLSFPNPDAFSTSTLATGVFVCDVSNPSIIVVSSSTGLMLGLPCTGGTDDATKATVTIQKNGILFTFQADFANLVLFTGAGNARRGGDGSSLAAAAGQASATRDFVTNQNCALWRRERA